MESAFNTYWEQYCSKSTEERRQYFDSLTAADRQHLVKSFFGEGWHLLFMQNILDSCLDHIKTTHGIDLIDLRIKAVKEGKVFLIDRCVWEDIENEIFQYSDYCNMDVYFGGLLIEVWGKAKQFYRVRAKRNKWR